MSQNPLLTAAALPLFRDVLPEHVGPAVDLAISAHKKAIEINMKGTGFDEVFMATERADAALSSVWQTVSHLVMVANTPELRAAHADAQGLISAHYAAVGQNVELFEAIKGLPKAGLSSAELKAIELSVLGFELSGVALAPNERVRFAELMVEINQVSTEFSNAVLDATEAWTLHIQDEEKLAGLSENDLEMLAGEARAKDLDGWLITLNYSSVHAIMAYADDPNLRRTVYEAFNTRASDMGPFAGKFDNSARILRILALKQEASALLGFPDLVARSLATKMARDYAEVEAFLLDLAKRANAPAKAELADLTNFAKNELQMNDLAVWDIAYVSEKLRKQRHSLDTNEIKRHLPLKRVLDGMFKLVEQLYGVEIKLSPNADVWHKDVQYFTLHQLGKSKPFASLYADVFARSGKRGGAWMDVCRAQLGENGKDQMSVAFLVCNFGAATEGKEAYIQHNDMVTLFHEMGHCLHHLLGEIAIPSVGGISGVEWDAVELPSQFMENFAWERDILKSVSAHVDTGEALSDALIDNMLSARRFLSGLALLRQVEFALFDLRLHLAAVELANVDVMEMLESVRKEVAVLVPPDWNRFPHAFSHIFAGGYAAGYYSYLWAELLSADAFEPFTEEGADRAKLGKKFQKEILSRGATRTALENFTAFRGRAPQTGALLRSWGLA